MRTLLVMRHGKSAWPDDPAVADMDRPLSKRGKRDARRIAEALVAREEVPDVVVSSPAQRARSTAKQMAKIWPIDVARTTHEALYGRGAAGWREALATLPDTARRVLVIGHNPALEDLLRALTGRWVAMKTSMLARVDIEIAFWREMEYLRPGELVYVLGVDQLTPGTALPEVPRSS
jgi:phosphohistidine phosphatase